jgi:hypothetical protein
MIEVAESLVVSFGVGANSDALVVLELDDELNGDVTSFAPGDDIFFRLHHDETVQLGKMLSTDGQVASQGSGTRTIDGQLLFAEIDDSHDLPYLVSSGFEYQFLGREATGLKRSNNRTVTITGGDLPSLAVVSYSASFSFFKLITPDVTLEDDESYPITVVAYMEAV